MSVETPRQADATEEIEIEVTEAMAEAGAEILLAFTLEYDGSDETAAAIYRAMAKLDAARGPRSD
jgi:hypothetical protein